MQDSQFKTIYNIHESVSGLGCISHFIGVCLFLFFGFFVISDILTDNTMFKVLIQDVISAGLLVTLGIAFIFVVCPIYFFVRFVMEFYRYKKCKREFYSKPNIEYIELNEDEIFFKNTFADHNFTLKKYDIKNVILKGKIMSVSYLKATHTLGVNSYVENLTLTINTSDESYTIYPQIKSNKISIDECFLDQIELLKQQIAFYKSYFDKIDILIDFSGTDTLSKATSMVMTDKVLNRISKKSTTDYVGIVYKVILIIALIVFIIYSLFLNNAII